MNMTENALNLVRNSGMSTIAAECHRLAKARGKYQEPWCLVFGRVDLGEELDEWYEAACAGDAEREAEEMGDLLHAVLSIAYHRGIDVEDALYNALRRNAERIGDRNLSAV